MISIYIYITFLQPVYAIQTQAQLFLDFQDTGLGILSLNEAREGPVGQYIFFQVF